MKHAPVIVLGVPRSGTRLAARLLGRAHDVVLTTEHSNKSRIPEDQSGFVDSEVWRSIFSIRLREEVEPDFVAESRLRKHYELLARDKRLIIKCPQHLVRLEALRRILPDALFVWIARDPWSIIASAAHGARKGSSWWRPAKPTFILRTTECLKIPSRQIIARVAYGLAYMSTQFEQHPGPVIRYEDLVAHANIEVERLYKAANIIGPPDADTLALPRHQVKDTSPIRVEAARSHMAPFIDKSVARYAEVFSYRRTMVELQ